MESPQSDSSLSAEYLTDSVEALLATHGSGGSAVYLGILGLLVVMGMGLPIVRVAITAQGRGAIRPAIERHEIRTSVGGYVARATMALGSAVAVGDTLVVLRAGPAEPRAERLRTAVAAAGDAVQDLTTLAGGSLSVDAVTSDTRLQPHRLRTPRYRQEHEALRAELAELGVRAIAAGAELDRVEGLHALGLAAAADLERARALASEIDVRRTALVANRLAGWEAELERSSEKLDLLLSELERASAAVNDHVLLAPVAGTLEEMLPLSPGSYIGPATTVGVISPAARLTAEVYVDGQAVGFVRPDGPVLLHLDAFDPNDWGILPGTVIDVSRDFLPHGEGAAFRVRIGLSRTWMTSPEGRRAPLKKGMTLTARFPIAERSLWQLLWDRIDDWLNPAGRPAD